MKRNESTLPDFKTYDCPDCAAEWVARLSPGSATCPGCQREDCPAREDRP